MEDGMKNRIPAGNEVVDRLIGGYEKDVITTIYGPAGSGKTLLCMLASLQVVRDGKKVIYIDTEGGFSVERLQQITKDSKGVLERMLFLRPTTFEGQRKAFERLKSVLSDRIGLIVIDTIAMLYRIEMGRREEVQETNKELGLQLAFLQEIARKKTIPVLITNQVYADFENPQNVKMVGGDILRYASKCLLEIQKGNSARRRIVTRKHRSIADGKEEFFDIVQEGVQRVEKERGVL